ncbi:hypothetical protein CEN40_15435 [Fischerella thermalis CCMEE 5205]|uniref:Uncharacterized protein n=1 Tax=Fischerella thermalis CCMEE 5318 TaxID=2019666 RepID=A0A2N6LPX4_9CYAN|nr:hypothetical protein CEN46_00325 [Fischerella thermalis CCMEE 5318]PMB43664.1 hypothetical protein CEN40_15435 [Fischerella thermalis CCMEE 5205]
MNFLYQNDRRWGQVPKPKIKSELCICAWHFMAASLALAQEPIYPSKHIGLLPLTAGFEVSVI